LVEKSAKRNKSTTFSEKTISKSQARKV